MRRQRVFLFGEAERGDYCTPLTCRSLLQLSEMLGNPPEETQGIFYAIQALLYNRELIFFRVEEEGFSTQDYLRGIKLLKNKQVGAELTAICMPGVGDIEIIEQVTPVCKIYKSLLIVTPEDLYDYLTCLN